MQYTIYDKKATLRILIANITNKNQKSQAECLDEISEYIQNNGVDHITKKDFNGFITCADAKDGSVRENALKVFGESYKILGEKIWSL